MTDTFYALVVMLTVAVTTFLIRAFPFIVFGKGNPPSIVLYIGKVISPAAIAMLIVYCFNNVNPLAAPHGIPELIATAVTVALQLWKRNPLISILVGTVIYMLLVQNVFM
ncbi:MAG: AzlD domain-containing protein [Candidatus Kapabacteria bacterium]|nr:AzlD domain-containing protein [Candidatus Kapabacteria bacterium]